MLMAAMVWTRAKAILLLSQQASVVFKRARPVVLARFGMLQTPKRVVLDFRSLAGVSPPSC